ncbi:hypothetical protein [Mangrovicella endophytica]|uniref:hypothetical protein n=1 Tax=Mangrovicella endophytica TaxID=2066697 RepID=UPI000C9EBCCE|nr:hypothetical protein [Mangrovicella endophytica]
MIGRNDIDRQGSIEMPASCREARHAGGSGEPGKGEDTSHAYGAADDRLTLIVMAGLVLASVAFSLTVAFITTR